MHVPEEYNALVTFVSYIMDIQGRRYTYPKTSPEQQGINMIREAFLKHPWYGSEFLDVIDSHIGVRRNLRTVLLKRRG